MRILNSEERMNKKEEKEKVEEKEKEKRRCNVIKMFSTATLFFNAKKKLRLKRRKEAEKKYK